MFDRIPNECLTCEAAFDKLNREMVMSWMLSVREQEKKVNLYCPCWDKANQILEDFKKRVSEKNNNDVREDLDSE